MAKRGWCEFVRQAGVMGGDRKRTRKRGIEEALRRNPCGVVDALKIIVSIQPAFVCRFLGR